MPELERSGRSPYVINGQEIVVHDSSPTARDLLVAGGFAPPSEHQLISIGGKRTRPCPHDDLLPEGQKNFRAFRGDELKVFTLDELSNYWGAESAQVSELLEIFGIEEDHELVLEREGEPDLVLTSGGEVDFGPDGVEDLVTRRRRPDKVLVSVLTTNGVFPNEGSVRASPDTLISDVLARAARRLHLTETGDWVVRIDERDIDPNRSFADNGLAGTVVLQWNARAGGGGA